MFLCFDTNYNKSKSINISLKQNFAVVESTAGNLSAV